MRGNSATNQSFILWGVVGLAVLGAFSIASSIGESEDAPFAIMANVVTALLALVAFISPRSGLYIVVFQAMFTDEFKRILVSHTNASLDLVIAVLIGPLITISVMNLSIFMKAVIFRTLKVELWYWWMQSIIFLLTISFFVFGEGETSQKGQWAANVGLYLSLLPMIALLLPTMQQWRNYIVLQILCVLPSAIWGIKQYFWGFTKTEWDYALTGLSQTHSIQMLGLDKPRIFGFLGSASAFGCMALYGTYALWQGVTTKSHRFVFLVVGLIMSVAIVLSTQRSMLLIPFIIYFSYLMMRSPVATGGFYFIMVASVVLAVATSQWMLDHGLDIINDAIRSDSGWGSEVFNVSTFSDRLRGWTQFLEPSTWSLFGTGASSIEEYSEKGGHDLVNKILITVGVAGLILMIAVIVAVLAFLHRIIWRAPTVALKNEGAFLLAMFVPLLIMNIMGGGNLNTVPINLQIWSMLAGILVFRNQYNINIWESKKHFLKKLKFGNERDVKSSISAANG